MNSIRHQRGVTISSMLASLVVVGAITTTSLPVITTVVNEADRSHLAYARSALISALHVNRLLSHDNQVSIDGYDVDLKYGFPLATATNIHAYAVLDGFDIDEHESYITIWSPEKRFCMTYNEPDVNNRTGVVSDIGVCTN